MLTSSVGYGILPFMSSLFLPQQQDPIYSSNNNSGSDNEPNQPASNDLVVVDEPRRSRMRKERHLQDLRNQMNRMKIENQDLANRLAFINHSNQVLRRDNDRLRYESSSLRRRLSDIRRILIFRQLQSLSLFFFFDFYYY
ncbi:hypothetical protein MKW92_015350 [Papaver armeniacum]|nr:hypothetical protein MKW92_015350 [Papaver armeniacum]